MFQLTRTRKSTGSPPAMAQSPSQAEHRSAGSIVEDAKPLPAIPMSVVRATGDLERAAVLSAGKHQPRGCDGPSSARQAPLHVRNAPREPDGTLFRRGEPPVHNSINVIRAVSQPDVIQ